MPLTHSSRNSSLRAREGRVSILLKVSPALKEAMQDAAALRSVSLTAFLSDLFTLWLSLRRETDADIVSFIDPTGQFSRGPAERYDGYLGSLVPRDSHPTMTDEQSTAT